MEHETPRAREAASFRTRLAARVAILLIAVPCTALAGNAVGITATSINGDTAGSYFRMTFTCYGTPVCTGVFTIAERDSNCTNDFTFSGTLTLNGVDLSHPGSFSGTGMQSVDSSSPFNMTPAPCNYTLHAGNTFGYTGTWDGTQGTLAGGGPGAPAFAFTATGVAPPPTFPMTVTADVTPTTSNVSAQIQPRAQDAGTTQSVFVFAYAPQSIVAGGKRAPIGGSTPVRLLDGANPCVLAQVDASGQVRGVTASTMQAFTTNVLGSQGQSVTILNNVATPNVAGATMFVGYGSSGTSMLSNGVYQGAVNIPGASQCAVNLAAAAAPKTPDVLTGLWFNASESGWGIHFTQRGTNTFAAWYTYDSAGKPKWYVATCAGATGASGTCSGTLYEVSGPNYFGGGFDPSLVHATGAGTVQIAFRDANNATMTYTAAGQTRTVAVVREPLSAGTNPPAVDYTDIWWNPGESGWGMAVTQQYGVTFIAWYVYDAAGKPTWLVSTCLMSGTSCSGPLYRTTGPAFGPTFNPTQVQASIAGTISVNFTDANNAALNYTVDGVSGSKAVTRQIF
ncbi:MAG: hypothetical protein ABI789_00075 [Usitatibacter sp.]